MAIHYVFSPGKWTLKNSLQDLCSAQVAVNLCQDDYFKEVALCLEKPTYGNFPPFGKLDVFGDKENSMFLWTVRKKIGWFLDDDSWGLSGVEIIQRWDDAVEWHSRSLTVGIPTLLRQGIHVWIYRIALEYLTYSRFLETSFGVSRYFLMNFFTRGDWTEAGRLDTKKLAQRLVEDERLTVLQRYRIACEYYLRADIPQLWERLTIEERELTNGNEEPYVPRNPHLPNPRQPSLLFYRNTPQMSLSYAFSALWDIRFPVDEHPFREQWDYAANEAILKGNCSALMVCWERLGEPKRQAVAVDMALRSFLMWRGVRERLCGFCIYKHELMKNRHTQESADEYLNMPSCYSELMRFFLTQMDEEQQMTFFKKAFRDTRPYSVLECFLDWPHQHDFLPTINRLWGILPKKSYVQCLLTLVRKFIGDDDKENGPYDYETLLAMLWEETPEEYKQYFFSDKRDEYKQYFYLCQRDGYTWLNVSKTLIERSLFLEKDFSLFKRIFRDQPREERRCLVRSGPADNICWALLKNEKWSFANWLLQECLPREEIPSYKKQLVRSQYCHKFCMDKLLEDRVELVEDLIDWYSESEKEKMEFKFELCTGSLYFFDLPLSNGKFTEVERVIDFCVPSHERKRVKIDAAKRACGVLLLHCVWEQMDAALAWSVDAAEDIRGLKKDLFSDLGIDIHYRIVFIEREFEKVKHFYEWFGLSPHEIEKLKKDTILTPIVIRDVCGESLHMESYSKELVASLRWCLTDKQAVFDLKKEAEKHAEILGNLTAEKRLNDLVRELLCGFREEQIFAKTSGHCVRGEKKSVGTEDESTSPSKKRRKSCGQE